MAIPAGSPKPTDPPPNGGMRRLEPMEVDLARIVLIGTVLYAIAAVILLPLHTSLTNDGHGRWPWVAVSGAGLGLLGLYYLKRRDRAIARDAAAKTDGSDDEQAGGGAADGPSAG